MGARATKAVLPPSLPPRLLSRVEAAEYVGVSPSLFDALVRESPDLQRLLRSPAFTEDEQKNAIGAILDRAGISGLGANFIRLVAAKRRLFALPDMIRAYRQLVADAKGIVRAQVTVAERPSDRVVDDIKAALKDAARAEIDLDLRGEGTLMSTAQKGRSDLRLASLRRDRELVRLAREAAFSIVDADPQLEGNGDLLDELRLLLSEEDAEFLTRS